MDFQVGSIGRAFVLRLYEGEELYEQIEALAARENVTSALVLLVGGLRSGKVVVGPKSPVGRPEPRYLEFDDAREFVGWGTIFPDKNGPKMHLHGSIGRGKEVITGCPRGGARVFCVMEGVMLELTGINAIREMDQQMGFALLKLLAGGGDSSGRQLDL